MWAELEPGGLGRSRGVGRCGQRGYRESISGALFEHVTNTSGLALCLQA